MTIREMLTTVKSLKPSQIEDVILVRWISELEARMFEDILCRYASAEGSLPVAGNPSPASLQGGAVRGDRNPSLTERSEPPAPFSVDDLEAAPRVAFPHDDLYVKWLCAQIDYYNGDFDRYNNAMVMFNNGYQAFADSYNRAHLPRQTSITLF